MQAGFHFLRDIYPKKKGLNKQLTTSNEQQK